MTDYLDRLIERSRGRLTEIRPRPATRFESPGPDFGAQLVEEVDETEIRPTPPAAIETDAEHASTPDRPVALAAAVPGAEASPAPVPAEDAVPTLDSVHRAEHIVSESVPSPKPLPRSPIQPIAAQDTPPGPAVDEPRRASATSPPRLPVALATDQSIPDARTAQPDLKTLPPDRPAAPVPASAESRPRAGTRPAESFDLDEAAWASPSHEPALESDAWPPAQPTTRVTVTIGRIEVRAPAAPLAPSQPRPSAPRRGPALPLDEYLQRRNGAGR